MAKKTRQRAGREPSLARRFERAVRSHEKGDFASAAKEYDALLKASPQRAEVWHASGVLDMQLGRPRSALKRLTRAVELNEMRAEYLSNLGAAQEAIGELEAAANAYRRAFQLEPDNVDTLFNAGLVQLRLDAPAEAKRLFVRMTELAPKDSEGWLNLSRAALSLSEVDVAQDACERAQAVAVVGSRILSEVGAQRGAIARHQGRFPEAIEFYERALEVLGSDPRILGNLGAVFHEIQRWQDAESLYLKSLKIAPELVDVRLNLARLYERRGALNQAYQLLRDGECNSPGHPKLRRQFARILRHVFPERHDPVLVRLIVEGYDDSDIDPTDLARAAASQIRHHPVQIRSLLLESPISEKLLSGGALGPLLLPFLTRSINLDRDLEELLLCWRGRLAAWLDQGVAPESGTLSLAVAMAQQTFNNEYIWNETGDETASADGKKKQLIQAVAEGRALKGLQAQIVRVALYRDLVNVIKEEHLENVPDDEPLARLLRRMVSEPSEQARSKVDIPRFGAVANETSRQVQAQYEENPYPRWLAIPTSQVLRLRVHLARQFPSLDLHNLPRNFDVLIAGCGTGEEPIRLALGNPSARVVGIDLSLASLAYARRSAELYDVSNLELFQVDLLQVNRLERRFDVIFATGVLHHLNDPVEGWQALVEVLTTHGLMRVALYSSVARSVLNPIREKNLSRSLVGTIEEVRQLRHELFTQEEPEYPELWLSEDMYTTSACRDLLFHAREHQFTLPQIATVLDELGLALIGFESPGPDARRHFDATPAGLTEFERWEQVEQAEPQTFQGMYQFWVRRKESDEL